MTDIFGCRQIRHSPVVDSGEPRWWGYAVVKVAAAMEQPLAAGLPARRVGGSGGATADVLTG